MTVNGPTGDLGIGGRGHDLAFEPVAGGRYQWPACYGYSHPTPGAATCLGRPEPDWSSEAETLVPTGAAWVDASGPASYADRFVFCTYVAGMRVFTPGSPHATVANGPAECRLDVAAGTGSRARTSPTRAGSTASRPEVVRSHGLGGSGTAVGSSWRTSDRGESTADDQRTGSLLERVTRIELAFSAWEADVLPLNYTRG